LTAVEQQAERVRRQREFEHRSEKGSEAKGILASLFGTWRLQGLDFYQCCLSLLSAQNPTL